MLMDQLHQDSVSFVVTEGRYLITGSSDGSVLLADGATLHEIFRFDLNIPVWDGAITPSGEFLAVGAVDGSLTLLNLTTEQPEWRVKDHSARVRSVECSPDGRFLVSGSEGRTVVLRSASDFSVVAHWPQDLPDHNRWSGGVDRLGFIRSGDALVVATSDEKVSIVDLKVLSWAGLDPQHRTPFVREIVGPLGYLVHALAVAPDQKRVVTSGLGIELCVWTDVGDAVSIFRKETVLIGTSHSRVLIVDLIRRAIEKRLPVPEYLSTRGNAITSIAHSPFKGRAFLGFRSGHVLAYPAEYLQ
jgi:WD40 repeat protein